MSIAIHTHRAARSDTRRVEATAAIAVAPSPDEQLRDMRALLRHFVLAFTASATAIYAIVATGLTG